MARINRIHHHSADNVIEGPFFGPVTVGVHQNPAAHGNITQHQTCSCGSSRRVLVNGNHRELGGWT